MGNEASTRLAAVAATVSPAVHASWIIAPPMHARSLSQERND